MLPAKDDSKRDLWLFLAGAVFAVGGKAEHSREELLGLFSMDDAPPDILRLLTALVEQQRGPVLEWMLERGAELGSGDSVFHAVCKSVTRTANEQSLRRMKDELVACRLMRPGELITFLEMKTKELRERYNGHAKSE